MCDLDFTFGVNGMYGKVRACSVEEAKRLIILRWARSQLPPGLPVSTYMAHGLKHLGHYKIHDFALRCPAVTDSDLIDRLGREIYIGVSEEGRTMTEERKLLSQLHRVKHDLTVT